VPYTAPSDDEVTIRNHAVGLNPVDWARQIMAAALFSSTTYPDILGADVVGKVVEVGLAAASRFKPGDHVLGLTTGLKDNIRLTVPSKRIFYYKLRLPHLFLPVCPLSKLPPSLWLSLPLPVGYSKKTTWL
jgi:hypothetical protein